VRFRGTQSAFLAADPLVRNRLKILSMPFIACFQNAPDYGGVCAVNSAQLADIIQASQSHHRAQPSARCLGHKGRGHSLRLAEQCAVCVELFHFCRESRNKARRIKCVHSLMSCPADTLLFFAIIRIPSLADRGMMAFNARLSLYVLTSLFFVGSSST
jgi:hypothetical protein